MPFQTASNVQIAIKRQVAKGTPASGAGATGYNVFPAQGMKLVKGVIDNQVIRRDGQKKRKRHGSRSGTVAYRFPLSQGGLDSLFEAGVRGTWTPSFDITEASTLGGSAAATSVTTTTNTIVLAAGSAILQGLSVGMMIKPAGLPDAANNGKWLRVVDLSADGRTITVPTGSLTANAVADTAFTITVAKHLKNPQTLTEYYHTIEEYRQDSGKSYLMTDAKVCKIEFSASPEGLIEVTITFMGLDVTAASSATFTNPTYATTVEQVMADGQIRIGGVDSGNVLTAAAWTWDMGGEIPKTLSLVGPDVFLGLGDLSGSLTALSRDLVLFDAYSNETVLDQWITCQEPDAADPIDFTNFYHGNLTLSDNSASYGQNGPLPEQVPWNAGIDETGVARALTTMIISSSAP